MFVNKRALSLKNDRYFYKESLFTGVYFFISNGLVKEKKVCENGMVVGDFELPFPLLNENPKHIVEVEPFIEYVEDYMEQFLVYLDTKPFSGVTYLFNESGYVKAPGNYDSLGKEVEDPAWINGDGKSLLRGVEISQYVKGYDESKACYQDGSLFMLEHVDNSIGLREKYRWNACGEVVFYSYQALFNNLLLFWMKDEFGLLSTFECSIDYFEELSMGSFHPSVGGCCSYSFLSLEALSGKLELSGSGITDEAITSLLKNNSVEKIFELHISSSSITSDSFFNLTSLSGLKKLYLSSCQLSKELFFDLRKSMPWCEIRVGNEI
ncbi:hypothetical protein [Marinibactrum halimedae]|uniref:WG repeat-containing protein n=1 Tax=Marinibactrum halimedae TaxID=1444977 RepID=A0AA37T8X6_9GAMM|nr:hypothetical protein [Marinibactrum halimedae]MCD9457819.1 hypothetical protein [Marinibactrum halimedae]GLS24807.1 hypothetical protein GCM10007877_05210 [Marinibactrum halimedae]